MKGMTPLTKTEQDLLLDSVNGKFKERNKILILLLLATGYRITEMLSIKMKDVYNFKTSKAKDEVEVKKMNTKGKSASRTIPFGKKIKDAIEEYMAWVPAKYKGESYPFFFSSKGANQFKRGEKIPEVDTTRKPIRRESVWAIFKALYGKVGLERKIGCHGYRKTYCKDVYDESGHDLLMTQRAMGHAEIQTTVKYMESCDEELRRILQKRND